MKIFPVNTLLRQEKLTRITYMIAAVALGDLVVVVLATRNKIRGLKPGQ
jgi:hypothetical protein